MQGWERKRKLKEAIKVNTAEKGLSHRRLQHPVTSQSQKTSQEKTCTLNSTSQEVSDTQLAAYFTINMIVIKTDTLGKEIQLSKLFNNLFPKSLIFKDTVVFPKIL